MRVCITGGAGFQGSTLSRALLARGDEVTILSTLSKASISNLAHFDLNAAKKVWGSVTDAELVHKTVREHDLVFHLAGNIHVDESRERPAGYFETNVTGTFNVAEECRQQGIPLFHVSTCEVYGGCDHCGDYAECDNLIDETCSLKPQSPYAASKAGGDCLVHSYGHAYGLPVLVVRPSNVFGSGQRAGVRGAVIPRFLALAKAGKPLTVYGDGSQGRDFLYIKDLIQAYLFLIDEFMAGKFGSAPAVFNLGTGFDVTVHRVAELIIELTGSSSEIIMGKPRPGEVTTFRLDSRKFLRGFAWQVSFREALEDYVRIEASGYRR